MTTLTLDMMREAMRKLGPPPPKQEIHCGDMDKFIHALERQTGCKVVRYSKNCAAFCGIEVLVSTSAPIDKAILFEDGKIKSIINLRDTTAQSK